MERLCEDCGQPTGQTRGRPSPVCPECRPSRTRARTNAYNAQNREQYRAIRARATAVLRSKPCTVDGCDDPQYGRDLCSRHYWRLTRRGAVGIAGSERARNGGLTKSGYRRVRVDGRLILEHRLVMEQMLGRPLLPDENVHHVNGVRDDNRPDNLELWSTSQPCGQRIDDKVAWALELLARYAPESLSAQAVSA